MISKTAFRKYDIRAIVEKELPLNEIYNLGCAISQYFLNKNINNIALGMDVRVHSPQIKSELCKAFQDNKINVTFIGQCATPTLYFATKTLPVQAGIMITASHNDKEYNGLKIVVAGECVWDKEIQEIYNLYKSVCSDMSELGKNAPSNSSSCSELKAALTPTINLRCTSCSHCVRPDSSSCSELKAALDPHCLRPDSSSCSELKAALGPHCVRPDSSSCSELKAALGPHCVRPDSSSCSELKAALGPHCVRPDSSSCSELKAALGPHCVRPELVEGNEFIKNNFLNTYIDMLVSKFEHLKNKNLNLAIDCGNGTAALIVPDLVKKMCWQDTKLIFENVDGNFPNHEPDPTKEKNLSELKKQIKENNFDFGLALDGDCDRFVVMDSNQTLISGDTLLTLFAKNLDIKGNVVFDIKCSNNVSKILKENNLTPNICATGHAHIKETMKNTRAVLGGELSGHFCFADKYYGFDDAIYALLRFVEIYLNENKNKNLFNFWPKQVNTPEFRIKCANINPFEIVENSKTYLNKNLYKITTIDGIRLETETSWAILRASNTEPVLSLRFEADNLKELNCIKKIIYDSICSGSLIDKKFLEKEIELELD